jgi:hypothetical protein
MCTDAGAPASPRFRVHGTVDSRTIQSTAHCLGQEAISFCFLRDISSMQEHRNAFYDD